MSIILPALQVFLMLHLSEQPQYHQQLDQSTRKTFSCK